MCCETVWASTKRPEVQDCDILDWWKWPCAFMLSSVEIVVVDQQGVDVTYGAAPAVNSLLRFDAELDQDDVSMTEL